LTPASSVAKRQKNATPKGSVLTFTTQWRSNFLPSESLQSFPNLLLSLLSVGIVHPMAADLQYMATDLGLLDLCTSECGGFAKTPMARLISVEGTTCFLDRFTLGLC
jgi:hypothetical protein